MFRKFLFFLLFLFSATPATTEVLPSQYFINTENIYQIRCGEFPNIWGGTGWLIGDYRMITAAHVVPNTKVACKVNLYPVTLTYINVEQDIAELSLPPEFPQSEHLKISCEGFIKGQPYLAVGMTKNNKVVQLVTGTGVKWPSDPFKNHDILTGPYNVKKGMSGGPIFNLNGNIVGINNATSQDGGPLFSLSLPLKDTYLCK